MISRESSAGERRLGVALVGVGGAVATTAIAGVELLRLGAAGTEGLFLADAGASGLTEYGNLFFTGWDIEGDDLAKAAEAHGVLEPTQLAAVAPTLSQLRPLAAVCNTDFCRNAAGLHRLEEAGHRAAIATIQDDLAEFRRAHDLDAVVLINVASTERLVDLDEPALASVEAFEQGLDRGDPAIGPSMLYAYAAITAGVPYANFTPSVAADAPALVELAASRGVPTAGKDGKTGQTMLKTVVAPALRARALRVDGWYSTNLLGNRDGHVLGDPDSLASKIHTKGSVLDQILGYHVEDHIVQINYYRPRGDQKEAWDNIDLVGFLGQPMQLKVNFLCRDSILAAPLVIELARVLDLAAQRGEGGVQPQLGLFFKAPTSPNGAEPEHALHRQIDDLLGWLERADAPVGI